MAILRKFGLWLAGADHRQPGFQSGQSTENSKSVLATAVNTNTALGTSAVWSCTKLITETISSLPLKFYDIDKNGARTLNTRHNTARLFTGKVNRWQTKLEYFETVLYQLVLTGNAYCLKQRGTDGKIVGLVPLMSNQMEVKLNDDGTVQYQYTEASSKIVYNSDEIWHLKLFGNAIIGLSPLSFGANAVSIAQGANHSVTDIYRNGGKTSGILTLDKQLRPEQRQTIKDNFQGISNGNENRLLVLEAGMQYQQVSLSPQDIELLQSRRFQVEEICRFFGVPSVLVNDTKAGTTWGSGIEQIVQGWYKLGLRPYLERIEASINTWFFEPGERGKIVAEFDFDALLRSDMATRFKTHKEGITGGFITPNEARKKEGLTAQPGGDKLFMQAQMTPIDMLPLTKGAEDAPKDTENQ